MMCQNHFSEGRDLKVTERWYPTSDRRQDYTASQENPLLGDAPESEKFTWMTIVMKSSFGRSEEVFPLRLREIKKEETG